MNSSGNDDDLGAGAASTEQDKPTKKSGGRKPPKKSVAAATAAAELEKAEANKKTNGKKKETEDDDEDEEEEEGKGAAGKEGKNMLVDHTYTNFAIVSDKELRMLDENSKQLPDPKSEEERVAREKLMGMTCTYGPMKKSAGGVVQPFPGKVSLTCGA